MTRVLVAMSGGVDSSVAAALMKADGHDVIGVTLKLWSGPDGELPTAGCCTLSDSEDARRVAAQLDIPYYVLDYTADFAGGVIERFVADYTHGRTPNPCVECNRTVKFSRLLAQAEDFECEIVATGHYARNLFVDGRWRLLRGNDPNKDQSYVLAMLSGAQLEMVRFPVGDLDKANTRRIATQLGLRTATKPESMDICFVGTRDYRGFLRQKVPGIEETGPLVDTSGEVLGEHDGIINFTVGQRRGLGVALGEPRFVTEVIPETRTVVLGRFEELAVRELRVTDVTDTGGGIPVRVLVQYRAHGEAAWATFDSGTVVFDQEQYAVAPGQTAAFYAGHEVVGSGVIAATA